MVGQVWGGNNPQSKNRKGRVGSGGWGRVMVQEECNLAVQHNETPDVRGMQARQKRPGIRTLQDHPGSEQESAPNA